MGGSVCRAVGVTWTQTGRRVAPQNGEQLILMFLGVLITDGGTMMSLRMAVRSRPQPRGRGRLCELALPRRALICVVMVPVRCLFRA